MFLQTLRSRLSGLLLLSWAVGSAQAQSPMDLATVLDLTLRHHPVMARIDAQRRQLLPSESLAAYSPPLQLGVDAENLDDRGADRLETTLSLSGVLEWGGQPQARVGVARSENEAVRLQLAQQRLDLLANTASRFIALVGAQEALNQTSEAQALARRTREATKRRQQAGAASRADLQRAELALAQAELAVVNAQQSIVAARASLEIATGAGRDSIQTVYANLDQLPGLPALSSLLSQAPDAPAVQLADAGLIIARSRLQLAQRQARPDLGWNLGIRDDRERDSQALVLGFSLPLGQSSRTRPRIAQADVAQEVATHARDIAVLDLQALLVDSWQALAGWKREIESLNTSLIPQSQAVVQALRDGYEQGRYSLLELSSAQRELNNLRAQQLAARIRYHQSWISLERLLGRPLIPENKS